MKNALLGMMLALAGCATAPEPIALGTSFNPTEVAWFNAPGNNTIRGNAVLRTVGGEVRTCAGLDARLSPVSTYATERVRALYGNSQSGFNRGSAGFTATDPAYEEMQRHTRCDSEGRFTFSGLPDGEYYVIALVTWGVPMGYGMTSRQGGWLMQRVRVAGGETKDIVLTAS